jgi:hypothetical protein
LSIFVVVKDECKNRKFRYQGSAVGDRILKAKNFRPAEIYKQKVEVCDEVAIKEGNASK